MPVSPGFANYRHISANPFMKDNGKMYVTVEHPNTKNHRDVRWYSDAEFAKVYGKKLDTSAKNLKAARGFEKGPILVIRNNRAADENWLKSSCARYMVGVGWYIASTDTFPNDAPAHLKYLLLGWKEMRDGDDEHVKKPTVISDLLAAKARRNEWINIAAA